MRALVYISSLTFVALGGCAVEEPGVQTSVGNVTGADLVLLVNLTNGPDGSDFGVLGPPNMTIAGLADDEPFGGFAVDGFYRTQLKPARAIRFSVRSESSSRTGIVVVPYYTPVYYFPTGPEAGMAYWTPAPISGLPFVSPPVYIDVQPPKLPSWNVAGPDSGSMSLWDLGHQDPGFTDHGRYDFTFEREFYLEDGGFHLTMKTYQHDSLTL